MTTESFWEVALCRINTPPCLWGQTQGGSARRRRAGPALECGKAPLVALAICPDLGGHQHNTKWETLITVPLLMLSFSLSTCHLWSHFRTGTELLKHILLRAGSFHSSTLGDCTSHAAKDTTFLLHFAFEAHLPAPLTLIINSIYGNFSLNHAHNGTSYMGKKNLKKGSTCLPQSEQHVSSLSVWFSLQAHVREPTSHTNTK